MPSEAVYIVQAKKSGNIKIGWTRNLWKRLHQIQASSGDEIHLRYHFVGEDMRPIEIRLHKEFAANRLHGEWFAPAPDLLALIDTFRAKMPPETLEWYDGMQRLFIHDPEDLSEGDGDEPPVAARPGTL